MRYDPAAHRLPLVLTEAERAIIARAVADQAVPGVDDQGFWSAPVIDTVVDALCDLMLSEGFHGEWQPTPLGREIEVLIDKLDGLLDESAAA